MERARVELSTKTGVKPQCKTAATSETQVMVGTMISPQRRQFTQTAKVRRLADEPEYEHACGGRRPSATASSKPRTWRDCVSTGSSCAGKHTRHPGRRG